MDRVAHIIAPGHVNKLWASSHFSPQSRRNIDNDNFAVWIRQSVNGLRKTREVEMKNPFIIIVILVFQTACSTLAPQSASQGALLSFTELAGEITVRREVATGVTVSSRVTEKDMRDSS